jgi:glyoxylase-like metal-dependent hydrolase (beta-lactamase superfamily II)
MNARTIQTLPFLMILLLSLLTAAGATVSSDIPGIDVQRLSDKAIVLKARGGNSNIVALDTGEGIVVFDTDVSPALAELIRERIEQEFGNGDFIYVINTHGHADHTNGNGVFPEAKVIGHIDASAEMDEGAKQTPGVIASIENVLKRFDAAISAEKDPKRIESLKVRKSYYEAMVAGMKELGSPRYPDITVSEDMELKLGDLTLSIIPFGLAHSRSDIVIHCPEEGLWVTGDLFFEGGTLYIDSERVGHIPRWIEVMENIVASKEGTRFIVPGHDLVLSMEVIEHALEDVQNRKAEFEGKESAFVLFKELVELDGLDAGLEKLEVMSRQKEKYYTLHAEIDQYGYRMMLDDKLDQALAVFQVLARIFPDVAMAYDSLGEVFMRKGDKEQAIKSFEKSLELDPQNRNAKVRLEELKK